ncbi:hypothetical protein C435_18044 [Haloarcula marismortui ATCC 33799]|uniref:Uncharacterized protein n=2 Tax=Haloarcula marismortui TaxID=2238 RepID=M0JRM8_9EURY|nr:hypothetical protein C435_18044 [Haloarcula californiae ATCC 33799]
MEKDYSQHQSNKKDLFQMSLLRRAYEILVMADYAPQLFARVILPLYQHDYVVCDRYFYDTLLTDLSGDVITDPQNAIDRYRLYEKIIPAPDYEFYVQIPPEVSMERKDDIPDIGYVRDRKEFYDAFAEANEMYIIDGTKTPSEVCETVLNSVFD